jgi:anti-sigma factor RsiW
MPDTPAQRLVGGLWCGQVLEALPDFVEGTLPDDVRTAAEHHLAGCDWCARFGGAYGALVRRLQHGLDPAPVDDDVAERLDERLASLLD